MTDFRNLPANMLRARVTNSTKFAKAKIFMVVAYKWLLFEYEINMYLRNRI